MLNNTATKFIKSDKFDLPCIILYGNEEVFLNVIWNSFLKNNVKYLPNNNTSTKKGIFKCPINKIDIEYDYSNHHFVIDYTDKHLPFIKHICSHKPFQNQNKTIILQNLHKIKNVNNQLCLKHEIDSQNIQFIITTPCLSKIHENIKSRSCCINCSFDYTKVAAVLGISKESLFETGPNVLITLSGEKMESLKILIKLDALLDKIKTSKSQIIIINTIREYVYNIYQLSIPLDWIMKYVIKKYAKTKQITQIISICSKVSGNGHILSYEMFFLELAKLFQKPNNV